MFLPDTSPRLLPLPSLLNDQEAVTVASFWTLGGCAVACLAFAAIVGAPLGSILAAYAILLAVCVMVLRVIERRSIAQARVGLAPLLGHEKAIEASLVPVSEVLIKIVARDLEEMAAQGAVIAQGPWSGRVTWEAGPEGIVPKGIAIHARHHAPQDTTMSAEVAKRGSQDSARTPAQICERCGEPVAVGMRPKTAHTRALSPSLLEQLQGVGGFDGRLVPWGSIQGMEQAEIRRKMEQHFKAYGDTALLRCVLPAA